MARHRHLSRRALHGVLLAVLAPAVLACSRAEPERGAKAARPDAAPPASHASSAAPLAWPFPTNGDSGEPTGAPRKGMVWILAGSLLAGTPHNRTPRVPDEELTGAEVNLAGFYIDEFPYPNEVAAIPKTGMNQEEALALCAQHGKRLCTELEWERACKGASNTTYEYGDAYRATECATGLPGRLAPSGSQVGCKSTFGVRDMHGGQWEWTASAWKRGLSSPNGSKIEGRLATLRGGNGDSGEVVGRCANGIGRLATSRRPDFGTRCCAGEPNRAEVNLPVVQGKPLAVLPAEGDGFGPFEEALKGKLPPEIPADRRFRVDRAWLWHPVGNEELQVAAGCAPKDAHLACGVAVYRADGEAKLLYAFAPSGWWMPVVKIDPSSTRDLWVFGGDEHSSFRRRIAYLWGRVVVGSGERTAQPTKEDKR
jgi:formylglycine-generating enzyme required for sulfatase activity